MENIADLPKAGDVAVILNYNQTSQKGQIVYHVVKTKQDWRIHDIETEHWEYSRMPIQSAMSWGSAPQ